MSQAIVNFIESNGLDMRVIDDRVTVRDHVITNMPYRDIPGVMLYMIRITNDAIELKEWANVSDDDAITKAEHMAGRMASRDYGRVPVWDGYTN